MAVNKKDAKAVAYNASDKDTVQDQMLGRVERAYWRPLSQKIPPETNKGMVLVPTLAGPYKPAWKVYKAASTSSRKQSASARKPVATTQSLSTSPRLDLFRKAGQLLQP